MARYLHPLLVCQLNHLRPLSLLPLKDSNSHVRTTGQSFVLPVDGVQLRPQNCLNT